ncbi:DEKNAAC102433 [Brettanomyces naardenensis]|uniref:DEKNAAC102433 n=1 Tax=Brettanomyces naardenensis TaxID=13370 RepID=A0A448YKN7_BRENA|nr:DEKNAAC102433 [Brettanomyces naardenensis]
MGHKGGEGKEKNKTTSTGYSSRNSESRIDSKNISTTVNDTTTGSFTVLNTTGHSSSSSASEGRMNNSENSTNGFSSEGGNSTSTSGGNTTSTTNSTNRSRKGHEKFIRESQRYSTGIFKEYSSMSGSSYMNSSLLHSLYDTSMTGSGSDSVRVYDDKGNRLSGSGSGSGTSSSQQRRQSRRTTSYTVSDVSTTDITNALPLVEETALHGQFVNTDAVSPITSEEIDFAMKQPPSLIIRERPEQVPESSSQPGHKRSPLYGYTFNLGNESSASSASVGASSSSVMSTKDAVASAKEEPSTKEMPVGGALASSLVVMEGAGSVTPNMPSSEIPHFFVKKNKSNQQLQGKSFNPMPDDSHPANSSRTLLLEEAKRETKPERLNYIQRVAKARLKGRSQDDLGSDSSSYDGGEESGTNSSACSRTNLLEKKESITPEVSSHHYSDDPERGPTTVRKATCPDSVAIIMIAMSILAPAFWILIAAGYVDHAFGTVPRIYKTTSLLLAIFLSIGVIIGICVAFGYGLTH